MPELTGLRSPLAVSVELERLRVQMSHMQRLLEVVLERLPAPADVLSTDEVRTLYGLSRSSLYDLSRRGVLTRVKRPGRRGSWWRRAEIEDYLRGTPEDEETRGAEPAREAVEHVTSA